MVVDLLRASAKWRTVRLFFSDEAPSFSIFSVHWAIVSLLLGYRPGTYVTCLNFVVVPILVSDFTARYPPLYQYLKFTSQSWPATSPNPPNSFTSITDSCQLLPCTIASHCPPDFYPHTDVLPSPGAQCVALSASQPALSLHLAYWSCLDGQCYDLSRWAGSY